MGRGALPKSPVPLWRAVKADPRAFFSDDEVARSKSYQRPIQYLTLAGTAVSLIEILLLIGLDVAPRLVRALGVNGWALQLVVILVAFIVVDTIVSLPATILLYRHNKRWEFETRAPALVAVDTLKNLVLNAVLFIAIFLPIWAVIRATTWWWLVGTLVILVVGLILALLSPSLQRIFNKFTPLEDAELRARLLALAGSAGARVREIFVMDASKRTRKDNAFFTGLGKTKRIVVFDNLLEYGPDEVEVVVAHEIGHWRRRHVVSSVIETALTGPIVLGTAALFLRWDWLMRWGGLTSERDPAAFPVFLLGAGVGFYAVTFVSSWLTRWKERSADLDALDLTRDLGAYRRLWRRMPARNLPDLDPSWWARMRASHPPVHQRIAFADVWERAHGSPGSPAGD